LHQQPGAGCRAAGIGDPPALGHREPRARGLDVVFADDRMRARTAHAAHNLATLKRLTLNLLRLDPSQRKGSLKTRRLIANTSDEYRAELLGLK
ncbi:hypothetical protein SAMN04244571_02841, partial [Azotobacter beijerinckii]